MMAHFSPTTFVPQTIAPAPDDGSGVTQHLEPTSEVPEPTPITAQEVGEYREQDRFLPVCFLDHMLEQGSKRPGHRLRMSRAS